MRTRLQVLALLTLSGWLAAGRGFVAADAPEGVAFFEKRIRPVLVEHCYECHSESGKKTKGGLALDSRERLLKGGSLGPGLVAGMPEKSLLIRALRHEDDDLRMPPKQKLSDAQIADFAAWVKMGAPDPRKDQLIANETGGQAGMSLEEGRQFWSLKAVINAAPPKVTHANWPRTAVDHFILARLEAAKVEPAPQADRRTLLRRVTFDLTGMPPTPGELDAFLADASANAFEKVVDRLLASPRYGERWGRHWLDVARYADTSGNASDYPVPQVHLYRDWVVRGFNRDLPYDQFLREQIAGDLMPGGTEAERAERIIATGYLALSRRFGGSRFGEHHLTLEDTIDNLGRTILGFSVACARCHDHKFDPFTMSDYYGLYGILSSTRYPFPGAEGLRSQVDFVPLMPAAQLDILLKEHREKLAPIEAKVKTLEAIALETKQLPEGPDKAARIDAAAKALAAAKKQRADVQKEEPVVKNAYAVADDRPANAKVHLRGDPNRLGDEVPRQFPAVLGGQELPKDCASSGRLQLAEWLTDPKNPLTARVMVNRVWQHHFGRGIVQTPNDFGRQGKPPTHPELLDFLAASFIESGWSFKALHKLILLSKTWQLECTDAAASTTLDPTNELYWKFSRRRLDAESLRDSLLFLSGELDETMGGPHPFPPQKSWGYTQHVPFMALYESRQRSIYLMQPRLRKHPYLALFDGADPSSSTGARLPSTTPLQALFLMNDPLAHNAAAKYAIRILGTGPDDATRLQFAYQNALTRSPTSDEQRECATFLAAYRERLSSRKTPAAQVESLTWAALSRALMSGNEFAFVD